MSRASTSRLRYSVRFLLLGIALCAFAFWAVPELYWRLGTESLSSRIVKFNQEAASDALGKSQPPLTAEEVVAAIKNQLPAPGASSKVNSLYARIARTQRLPPEAQFIQMNGYQDKTGVTKPVWWVNLDLSFKDGAGFGLRVREENSPK